MTTTRLSPGRRAKLLVAFVAAGVAALLASPPGASAESDPFVLFGTGSINVFEIKSTTDNRIQLCTDGFCPEEDRNAFDAIIVDAFDGDDVLKIHQDVFMTNGRGGLSITFHGGGGADILQICPDTCDGSGVSTTVYQPGPAAGEGRVVQASAAESTTYTFDSVASIEDRSPGALRSLGTPDDDAITFGQGASTTPGRLTVGGLPPLEFSGKDSLDVAAGEGADRVELEHDGAGFDATGDCGAGARICVSGEASLGDRLVVRGVSGSQDLLQLDPTGPGAGGVSGFASTPNVAYEGIEAIDVALQHGGVDRDTFSVSATGEDDLLEVRSSPTPGRLTLDGLLASGGLAPFPLPAVSISGANTTDVGMINVNAQGGTDELRYHATPGQDLLTLGPSLAADSLVHHADGRVVNQLSPSGFSRYIIEAVAGEDVLDVAGNLSAGIEWRGGDGADRVVFDGTGGKVAVALAAGTIAEAGFPGVTAAGTETLDVGAGGGSLASTTGSTADTVRYAPTGASAGVVRRDGDTRVLLVRDVGGVLSLDPSDGALMPSAEADVVVVEGTASGENIAVNRSDELAVQVGSLLPVRIAAPAEAVRVLGMAGDDRISVAGSGGPPSLTVEGGSIAATDTLAMTVGVQDAAVTLGSEGGRLVAAGPPVDFLGMESVELEGDGTGTVGVMGSGGPDSITQSANVVRVGAETRVAFAGFATLTVGGGAANDDVTLNPRGTVGLAGISVQGGDDAGLDTLTVNGTSLGETTRYRPTGAVAGRVLISGAPEVEFGTTEGVILDGATAAPSRDTLVVDTGGIDGTQVLDPGPTFDSGSVLFLTGDRTLTTAPPVSFGGLGQGTVRFEDAAPGDTLVYRGLPGSDVFSATAAGALALNSQVPVQTQGAVTSLVLEGRDGTDTFNLPADHPFSGAAGGPGIRVDGGNPDGGDVVNLLTAGLPATLNLGGRTIQASGFAATALAGVERLNVDAAMALSVLGSDAPESLRYTPTGAQAGAIGREGDSLEVRFTGLSGELTIDPLGGADRLVVDGRSTDDAIMVSRGDPSLVQVDALKPVRTPAATEALQVLASDGADTITVMGMGGPASLSLAGGGPTAVGDRLNVATPGATLTYDVVPSGGLVETAGGAIAFAEMETLGLQGDGTGAIGVRGTNGPDSVSVGNTVPPQVRVNGGAALEYAGYPSLSLDGRGGDDSFSLSYLSLGDPTTVDVAGGDPSASDELLLQDAPGRSSAIVLTPTAPDAGTARVGGGATIRYVSTESVVADGMDGGDQLRLVTPEGVQAVSHVPGAADDAGTARIGGLVPVSYRRLGTGSVRIVDAGGMRVDSLTVDGTAGGDRYLVQGATGSVRLNGRVPILTDAAQHLLLPAFDGDDTFDVTGPLSFETLRTDGGGPDRADALTLAGPVGPARVDLGGGTLTGYGGIVFFPGIEQLSTDIGGGSLTEVGTALDDALCYDPLGQRAGRAYVAGSPGAGGTTASCAPDLRGTNTLHSFTDAAELLLDPAGGADEVIVNGTTDVDLVTLHLTAPVAEVTVHPNPSDPMAARLIADVLVATTERLIVATDNGDDTIDASVYNNLIFPVLIDGEDPSTKLIGDELRVRDQSGRGGMRHTKSHTFGDGTVFVEYRSTGIGVRVDYTRVESIALFRDSKT